jgi:hypothetical protein
MPLFRPCAAGGRRCSFISYDKGGQGIFSRLSLSETWRNRSLRHEQEMLFLQPSEPP